jgi:hypothetical protein
VHVGADVLGRFTVRVAMMETIAIGARPKCISLTIPIQRGKTSSDIVAGVLREVSLLGYAVPVIESTENNFRVYQTGLGVTVIGIVKKAALRLGTAQRGDVVLSIGSPFVGTRVISAEKEGLIADLCDVIYLAGLPYVHEIIPVGSRGIRHETATLAKDSNLKFTGASLSIDSRQSAGPGTVILCCAPADRIGHIAKHIRKPLKVVGALN